MKILVGALAADQGTVTRTGRLGYCPQQPLVYPRLTCDEHFDLFGRAAAMTREDTARSRQAIYEALGFTRYARTRADQLSGGTLAKLNLGLALLPDPDLLLLDEPSTGFDWDTYLKFWDLVPQQRTAGRTVLIISHFVVDEDRFDRIVAVRRQDRPEVTTLVLVRRFLTDYVRNPVNLLLLALIPTVFVVVTGGTLAKAAKMLGGTGGPAVQTATAGWAAAFVAGVAMYFQTAEARDTDRRVVIAGLPAGRLTLARLLTGGCLALLASVTALVALALRTGIDDPMRAIAGTLMFAVIYVAIGSVVGSVVPNPVNGTVIVLFVWIVEVFFGPVMGTADLLALRWLPTHFVTLWMVDLPSGHGGRIGDLGWALTATIAAIVVAWAVAAARTRTAHRRVQRVQPGSTLDQVAAASRAAWRDARRNPVLWVLLVVVPVGFILGAYAVTPDNPLTFEVVEGGRRIAQTYSQRGIHVLTGASSAVAFLAALVGLFTVLDSGDGDRRAALSGMRPAVLLSARLGVITLAVLLINAVSLAATALVFDAARWPTFAAAMFLIAITYGLLGALIGPIFGRVGGVFIAFLLPFLDIGILQGPLLTPEPTALSRSLPGYGASRVLLDGALTQGFDEVVPLLIALGWLAVLALAVVLIYRRTIWPGRALRPASAQAAGAPTA